MDINQLRAALTVLVLLIFVAIVVWAYGARSKPRFEHAARSVLDDEAGAGGHAAHEGDAK
jgi:cytochrome c oxidase cbb3-type subunit IV